LEIAEIFRLVLRGEFDETVQAQAKAKVRALTERFPLYRNVSYTL
jgi:glycine hydroxymethyltransferase